MKHEPHCARCGHVMSYHYEGTRQHREWRACRWENPGLHQTCDCAAFVVPRLDPPSPGGRRERESRHPVFVLNTVEPGLPAPHLAAARAALAQHAQALICDLQPLAPPTRERGAFAFWRWAATCLIGSLMAAAQEQEKAQSER